MTWTMQTSSALSTSSCPPRRALLTPRWLTLALPPRRTWTPSRRRRPASALLSAPVLGCATSSTWSSQTSAAPPPTLPLCALVLLRRMLTNEGASPNHRARALAESFLGCPSSPSGRRAAPREAGMRARAGSALSPVPCAGDPATFGAALTSLPLLTTCSPLFSLARLARGRARKVRSWFPPPRDGRARNRELRPQSGRHSF